MAGIEFVWISLVKAEKSTWGAFAQANEPTGMVCRRLLQLSGSASSYACAEWDLLDGLPASAEVEIGSMREATQASSERWRWIPNTGEFLVLDNVAVRVRNKAGLALPLDSGYSVRLKGAYDRFWDVNKGGDANGNIYNNKAMGINVATLNLGGSIAATATLSTITEANGERLYSAASDDIGSFTVSKGGWLERDGSRARLGIRPLSAEKAYPGDDYVLSFTVEYAAGGTGTPVTLEARTDAKDYVAVYDKKMLWRANLYIDQKEEALGNMDWNTAHPWNAPPSGSVGPVWWSVAWGNNEWNRIHDGQTAFTGIRDLAPGNGGQTVVIAGFAPLRVQNPNGAATAITGRVAYSYPMNPFEPPYATGTVSANKYVRFNGVNWTSTEWMGDRGDAGSMDSPFDFNAKLIYQLALRGTEALMVPQSNHWWAYSQSTETGVTVGSVTNQTSAMPSTATALSGTGAIASRAFIPSLGLWYKDPEYAYNTTSVTEGLTLAQLQTDRRGSWIYEAGTDCIGFAQRSASYNGNVYQWADLPKGITELGNPEGIGSTNNRDALAGYGVDSQYRRYPHYQGDATATDVRPVVSDLILRKPYNQDSPAGFASLSQDQLKRIVPGDVFYYDTRAHIALVNKVEHDAQGNVTAINLIESTFDGYEKQTVITANTLRALTEIEKEPYYTRTYQIVRLRRTAP